MPTKICVPAMKGGVGKTALVANIAGFLANEGNKVLVVGVDKQEDITDAYLSGNPDYDPDHHVSLTDIIKGEAEPEEAIVTTGEFRKYDISKGLLHVKRKALNETYTFDMIPAGGDATSIDEDDLFYFDHKFESVFKHYDYVLFDTPPADHDSTLLVYIASDWAIVPVFDMASFKSVQMVTERIQWARSNGSNVQLMGVVINKFNGSRKLSEYKESIFREAGGDMIFDGVIRESSGVENAFAMGIPLVSFEKTPVLEDFYHIYAQVKAKL